MKDSILTEAIEEHVESSIEFFREYVCSNHGHIRLCPIPKPLALSLVEASPYASMLSDYMVIRKTTKDAEWDSAIEKHLKIIDVVNKGAIRITPSPFLYYLMSDDEGRSMQPQSSWKDLWVYKHDTTFWLTTVTKEEHNK